MSSLGPQVTRRSSTSVTPKMDDFFISEKVRSKLVKKVFNQLKDKAEITYIGKAFEIEVKKSTYQVIAIREELQGIANQELSIVAFKKNDKSILLGAGGSGEVVLGQDIKDGRLIAVKVHKKSMADELSRERRNLKLADSFVGIAKSEDENDFTLMEYYRGLTLFHVLYSVDKLKLELNPQSTDYISKVDISFDRQLELVILAIDATIFLHDAQLAHRDIKPDNLIFVRKPYGDVLKFVDFGSSVELSNTLRVVDKRLSGTFGYYAPEVLLPIRSRAPYDFVSDLFALGVVIAEIFTKQVNYQEELLKLKKVQLEEDALAELTSDQIKALMSDVFLRKIPVQDNKEPSLHVREKSEDIEYHPPVPKGPVEERIWDKVASIAQALCKENPTQRPTRVELKAISQQLKILLSELRSKIITAPGAAVQRLQEYKDLRRIVSELNPDLNKDLPALSSPKKSQAPSPSSGLGIDRPSTRKLTHADEFARFRSYSHLASPQIYLPSIPALPSESDSLGDSDVNDLEEISDERQSSPLNSRFSSGSKL